MAKKKYRTFRKLKFPSTMTYENMINISCMNSEFDCSDIHCTECILWKGNKFHRNAYNALYAKLKKEKISKSINVISPLTKINLRD